MGQIESPGLPSEKISVADAQIHAWHGVRYAIAHKRFEPALPASGRIDASRQCEVPIFPQLPSRLSGAMGNGRANPQAEDAFFLNIWAQADAKDQPVILFIHGGAWMTGAGAMSWYDGSRLAATGVVVINVNYRLGALGHLGQPDAHDLPIPVTDLLLAIQWLKDNVHAYGGDPEKLTLVGQSSGGWYAHLLSCVPQTRGSIQRVALLSMGTRTPWLPQQQIETTIRATQNVGGDIQGASVEDVLKAGIAALAKEPTRIGHAPSAFLPVASAGMPGGLLDPVWAARSCHAKAVYVRYTSDEAATFFFNAPEQRNATQAQVDEALSQWSPAELPCQLKTNEAFSGASSGLSPYRQLVAAASWRQFQRFPTEYEAQLQLQGRNVKLTTFQTESLLEGLHCGHCFDLPFQFGNLVAWSDAPMLKNFDADAFEVISKALITEIADFAKGPDEHTYIE